VQTRKIPSPTLVTSQQCEVFDATMIPNATQLNVIHTTSGLKFDIRPIAAARGRFNRIRQVEPICTHNRHKHRTGSAPCWVTLSISTVGHVPACPALVPFRPQNCPFSHPIHSFLGQPESMSQTASRSVQPFLHSSRSLQIDRQTDRQTTLLLQAKFHYASWFEVGSKLVADRFEAGPAMCRI